MEISKIRVNQFNKMVRLLRDIRTFDVRYKVVLLKREGHTREQALELIVKTLQKWAVASRGIGELRAVSNTPSCQCKYHREGCDDEGYCMNCGRKVEVSNV